jgi:hypothetical protein
MPALPNAFSPVEHFQDTAKKAFNKEVREWFSEITSDELDINAPRSSLRTACTHQEADSLILTVGRIALFELTVRKDRAEIGEIGGRPHHTVARRGHPQVILFFLEDSEDVDPEYSPVAGRVSFRLMDETSKALTKPKLIALGNKIKAEFAQGGGYIWKKGRDMLSYTDWDEGYQLQILCTTEAEGKRLVDKILDLRSNTPDWSKANLVKNLEESQAYPIVPPKELLLGESRRMARRRPKASVRFQSAWIEAPGLPNRLFIFDRSGYHRDALVTGY